TPAGLAPQDVWSPAFGAAMLNPAPLASQNVDIYGNPLFGGGRNQLSSDELQNLTFNQQPTAQQQTELEPFMAPSLPPETDVGRGVVPGAPGAPPSERTPTGATGLFSGLGRLAQQAQQQQDLQLSPLRPEVDAPLVRSPETLPGERTWAT